MTQDRLGDAAGRLIDRALLAAVTVSCACGLAAMLAGLLR